MKERVSMLTNQVKTELHGWQFCAPVLHQQQPALPVPRLWTHTCPGQHSIFHFLFTFTEIRFRHNTFCAFVCCKVLTAQTAFGAKNERLYNKYYPLCVHRKWFLSSFPRGHTILALLWHSAVTPQWGRAMLYMSWREMPQNANISSQGCQKSFPLGCVFPSAELRNVKKINELYYLYFPSRWEGNRKKYSQLHIYCPIQTVALNTRSPQEA